jgi:lysozyme
MTDRQRLVHQLVLHEGERLKPYIDTVGNVTIGIGRNLTDKGISSDEAFLLLDHDIDECIRDLTTFAWFSALDDVRQRVIVDVRFNVGASGFRGFQKMIHALAIDDLATASSELLASVAAKQNAVRYGQLARMLQTGFDEIA